MAEPMKSVPFEKTLTPDMRTAPAPTGGPSEATPYGPQPHGVDAAAGGADSSPLDTESTGDPRRADAARKRTMGQDGRSDPARTS